MRAVIHRRTAHLHIIIAQQQRHYNRVQRTRPTSRHIPPYRARILPVAMQHRTTAQMPVLLRVTHIPTMHPMQHHIHVVAVTMRHAARHIHHSPVNRYYLKSLRPFRRHKPTLLQIFPQRPARTTHNNRAPTLPQPLTRKRRGPAPQIFQYPIRHRCGNTQPAHQPASLYPDARPPIYQYTSRRYP